MRSVRSWNHRTKYFILISIISNPRLNTDAVLEHVEVSCQASVLGMCWHGTSILRSLEIWREKEGAIPLRDAFSVASSSVEKLMHVGKTAWYV